MPKCQFSDISGQCSKRARFGYIRGEPEYCSTHKNEEMFWVDGKFCGCGKGPTFGFPGEKPSCCIDCKTDKMINVKAKKCVCGKHQPYYALPGKKAAYCAECKESKMIDVRSKKCKCGKSQPVFGFPKKKAICCAECQEDGMIDRKNKKCRCGKHQPHYGYEGEQPSCCRECKKEDMIGLKGKICKCGKSRASFGYDGKKPVCCSQCKDNTMIILNHSLCKCGKVAIFGHKKLKPLCCAACKTDTMIDVKNQKCAANDPPYNIPCSVWRNYRYDGFCTHCFAHLFPDHPKTAHIRAKSKEIQVVHYVSSRIPGFIHDKPLYVDLSGGCCPSKRRIDLRKLINNTLLCIEVDEHQHRGYCKVDEKNRYNDLFMDFSGKYVFVRFNPDKFKDSSGKNKNPYLRTRLPALMKEIEKHTERIQNNENQDLLEINHLYYDTI